MKKLFVISSLGIMFLTGATTVHASEVNDTNESTVELEVGAGIKPDSPLYFLDKGWEDFRLWAASNEEKESKLLLKYAEERLSELDSIDDKEADKYADKLYEEYGVKLETVNNIIAKLVSEGKLDADKLESLQDELDDAADLDDAVDEEKVAKVTTEIKNKIKEVQTKAYAVSIATGLDAEQLASLKEQGYGYGEIVKLQAIATLANTSIEELQYLDIFVEDEDGEMTVDFGKLADELGLDHEEIREQLRLYKDAEKEARNSKKADMKQKQEAKKAEIKQRLSERMNEIVIQHQDQFLTRIEAMYNAKVALINELNITDEEKTEIIAQLEQAKVDLVEEVQALVESDDLNPRDIGELNRLISEEFNEVVKDLELSDEDKTMLEQHAGDFMKQVSPLVNQTIVWYQRQNDVTFTEEQIASIKEEIRIEAQAIVNSTDEDKDEQFALFISELRTNLIESLEELTQDTENNA